MIRVRRKFALIVILMVFTALTLTVSTYAWFEMNKKASINDISMTVTDGEYLSVSLDGKNFKKKLTYSDLFPYVFGIGLDALTTSNGIDFVNFDGNKALKSDLLEFDIYFKLDYHFDPKTVYGIYLSNYNDSLTFDQIKNGEEVEGTAVVSSGIEYDNQYTFLYDYLNGEDIYWNIGKYTVYQQEAMRLSFTYDLNDDQETTIFDLSDNPLRSCRYCPNPNKPEREYGAFQFNVAKGNSLPSATRDYNYQVITRNEFSEFIQLTNVKTALNNNSLICTLAKQEDGTFVGKTTFRAWIEGWDADCFDAILKDKTEIQLEFCFGNIYK